MADLRDDDVTPEAVRARHAFAGRFTGADLRALAIDADPGAYAGNVERLFGAIQLPLGLAGPLRLNGEHARGEFLVPLATTEGTLVASYNRGMKAIAECGGARVRVTKNEIYSSFTLVAGSAAAVEALRDWIEAHQPLIAQTVAGVTRHGTYLRSECTPWGFRLVVNLVYDPAEAMGINMITDASFAVAGLLAGRHPGTDVHFPSAFQADKKATFYGFHRGRGRSVTADVTISAAVLEGTLRSSADAILRYHLNNVDTARVLGGQGFNMHVANGVTALALATGQDPAYVGESANANLIVEAAAGGLYFSLGIPSLYVGTVGGGTGLPTARPCLQMLGCSGKGSALKLAEIFAGTCLAGEISVLAAIASKRFVAAHNRLGRNRPAGP
jgi:hydroxymethylglutaryl-CoA reductase (NADPH)